MNKIVIFLFIALAILIFSIISICVAPVFNNILGNFSNWGQINCQQYADIAKFSKDLDQRFINEYKRDLCYRKNAMYGLEYSSLIIDIAIGFLCGQLALLHYFQVGKSFEKTTGLIGLIGGAIGFVLTLVYVCYSGYIFNNDVAYGTFDSFGNAHLKLFPNGAYYKKEGTSGKVTIFNNDKEYLGQYFKYKDLGDCQYNYNKKLYQAYNYYSDNCKEDDSVSNNCEYFYPLPADNNMNKYLYDRWCLSLVLSVFITAANIGLLIFGLLIFKSNGDSSSEAQPAKLE
jgi:hypothetical protein